MAGGLPKSGVSLVAEGASAFMSSMNSAKGALGSFEGAAGKVSGAVSGLGQVVTGAMREIGAIVTRAMADAGRALAGFFKDSLGTAGDFEQTINVLGVTSKASADQLAAVSAKAKELGADLDLPATSANDAAQVMLELAKSGFTVEQAMDAAKGALQLAAAAETDAANAAQVVAGAINSFELSASDATRVVDLLAGAANASQSSMTDLAQGFQQGGFAFHTANQSIDDLATSLAILTKNNLTGSDSGTALKNAFMRLMNPTKKAAELMADLGFSAYDANGKMKPLPQLIGELNRATAGMTDKQRDAALGTIFLSDGMKAMIPLLAMGEDGFNGLKGQVTASGQAAAIAKAQMDGWNGALAGAQSQLETLQLTIGQKLLPLLTPLAKKMGELIGIFNTFAEGGSAGLFTGLVDLGAFIRDNFNPTLGKLIQEAALSSTPFATLKTSVLGFLGDVANQLPTKLLDWAEQLGGWVWQALPKIQAGLQRVGAVVGQYISEQAPIIAARLVSWAEQFGSWALKALPNLMLGLSGILDRTLTWISENGPAIETQLGIWAQQFGGWAAKAVPIVLLGLYELRNKMLAWFVEQIPAITAQLGIWAQQFGGFAQQAGPGMLAGLTGLATQLWTWLQGQVPAIQAQLATWGQQFATWVTDALPGLIEKFGTYQQTLMTKIGEALPGIVAKLAEWGQKFSDWVITDALPKLLTALGQMMAGMLGYLAEHAPDIASTLATWTGQFVLWAVTTTAKLVYELGVLFGKLLGFLIDHAPEIAATLRTWAAKFGEWVTDAAGQMLQGLGTLWGKLKGWMSETASKLAGDGSIGSALIDGIKAGIAAALPGLISKAAAAVKAAINAAKSAGIIHSPSEAMAKEVGEPLSQGIAAGMQRATTVVQDAAAAITRGAISSAEQALAGVGAGFTKKAGSADNKADVTAAEQASAAIPSLADSFLSALIAHNRNNALLVRAPFSNSAGLAHGGMGPVTNSTTNYTMPVYTNQNPAVVQQSFAMMQAMVAQ